jgi:hypothetical protein
MEELPFPVAQDEGADRGRNETLNEDALFQEPVCEVVHHGAGIGRGGSALVGRRSPLGRDPSSTGGLRIFSESGSLLLTVAHKKSRRAIRTTRGWITVRMVNGLDQRLRGYDGFDALTMIRTRRY